MIHVWDLVDVFVIEICGNHVKLSVFVLVVPTVSISADVVSIRVQVISIPACLHLEPCLLHLRSPGIWRRSLARWTQSKRVRRLLSTRLSNLPSPKKGLWKICAGTKIYS